jgi:hypothetical protein
MTKIANYWVGRGAKAKTPLKDGSFSGVIVKKSLGGW